MDSVPHFKSLASLHKLLATTLQVKSELEIEKSESDWECYRKTCTQLKASLKEGAVSVKKTKEKREAQIANERKAAEKKRALAEKERVKEEERARKRLMTSGGCGHIWEVPTNLFGQVHLVGHDSAVGPEHLKEPLLIPKCLAFEPLLGLCGPPAGSDAAPQPSLVNPKGDNVSCFLQIVGCRPLLREESVSSSLLLSP